MIIYWICGFTLNDDETQVKSEEGVGWSVFKRAFNFPKCAIFKADCLARWCDLDREFISNKQWAVFLASFNTVDSCPYGHWTRVTGSIAKEDIECKQSLHFWHRCNLFYFAWRDCSQNIIIILYISNLDNAARCGSVFFRPLLGAELVVLDIFLCKM